MTKQMKELIEKLEKMPKKIKAKKDPTKLELGLRLGFREGIDQASKSIKEGK